jgi:HAD superfamily hydrolase (TIGR01509 family)
VIDLWQVQAVLLDVDGTLVDSNGAHARAYTQALREHGIDIQEDAVRRLIGMGSDKLLPAAAQVSQDSPAGKAIAARKEELFHALLPALKPTRGARALLEHLYDSGIELAVATSADERELEALLDQAGLEDLIPVRSTKDDAAESKPDPDVVQAALARARISAGQALLVGDTPYDVEAGRRAGVSVVALRCGGFWRDEEMRDPSLILDDPEALLVYWRERTMMRTGVMGRTGHPGF